MVIRTMLPPLAMSFTFSTTLKALVESRPEVGSSGNSSDGLWMISTPIDTLRRSPPDTPLVPSSPMYVCAAFCTFITTFMASFFNSIIISSGGGGFETLILVSKETKHTTKLTLCVRETERQREAYRLIPASRVD